VPQTVVLDRDAELGIGEVHPRDEAVVVEDAELCHRRGQAAADHQQPQARLLGRFRQPVRQFRLLAGTGAALADDRRRINRLVAAGWVIVHVTLEDLRRPAQVLARIRAMRAQRLRAMEPRRMPSTQS
jgi:hypothetical protein